MDKQTRREGGRGKWVGPPRPRPARALNDFSIDALPHHTPFAPLPPSPPMINRRKHHVWAKNASCSRSGEDECGAAGRAGRGTEA